jgi:hypothetical protein
MWISVDDGKWLDEDEDCTWELIEEWAEEEADELTEATTLELELETPLALLLTWEDVLLTCKEVLLTCKEVLLTCKEVLLEVVVEELTCVLEAEDETCVLLEMILDVLDIEEEEEELETTVLFLYVLNEPIFQN